MVLERLITLERSEIGLLKAFGYSNAAVGWHYTTLVVVIACIGVALGVGLGIWFGRIVTAMYAEFYNFPFFLFRPSPGVFVIASTVSTAAALLGTARAVRRAVRLPPAQAMREPSPTSYATGGLSAALERPFDQPTRMVLRHVSRYPGRSMVTVFGISMAVGLLVTSLQWQDAIERLVEVYFYEAQHQDVTVGLVEPRSLEVTRSLQRLPGVERVQPIRAVTARLTAGQRSRRESLTGIPPDASLAPVYDVSGYEMPIPDDGLLLSTKLAELLGVVPGDAVRVEVLEGRRPVRDMPVSGVFETYLGTPAYVRMDVLNRMMGERPAASGAHLAVDPARTAELNAALKELPVVSAVTSRRAAVQKFHDTMAETMLIFVGFFTAFSCMLAFGVTYNSTRVALSERARELATLRVLGVTRMEISYILLGEMALLTLLGLPIGCLTGYGISWLMTTQFETELYRVPLLIEDTTYGWSVLICVAATVVSAALVRRRLDRLDLISVLKTRE
ncbi:MAG TPA: ABC transporter permease, partial [Alphaproteobacteria bacterium]|nr:ABC transporter permease [Alphaproteobacteria bacterium]